MRLPGVEGRAPYHLPSDPGPERNVLNVHLDVAKHMHQTLIEFPEEATASAKRIRSSTAPQPWLTMSPDGHPYAIREAAGRLRTGLDPVSWTG